MAPQAAQFDLSTSFLDIPDTLAYGLVRGAGNKILQQELADKSRVAFYILGRGRWDSLLRLWINNKAITLPSSTTVHFHPGDDGEMGNGLSAVSTGGDQHVDQFFTLIPGGLDPITFSRYAWLALKVAPDPGAPTADLTVLADYQAMQVRQFDSSGNQTAFAWTQNWAWIICDFLINKFVLREGKINQPLVAAELARFDWPSFSAAATYYDAVLSGGQKRFSDGGVVYVNSGDTADKALEQMLMMCRSYMLERNGKMSLYADQPRASVFTFTSDNTAAMSFKAYKTNLRAATNRLTPTFRDLNIATGSSDDATRFAIASDPQVNHEAHQRTVGARGAGLSVIPKITELALDLGVNTPERVWRILDAMLVRHLGDDVDANSVYNAPFSFELTGFEDSLAVEPGDVTTIDPSLSEEFGGKLVEILESTYHPDGAIDYVGLEYMPNAFPDTAPPQQALEAPIPGAGLNPAASLVDANGNLLVPIDSGVADGSIYLRSPQMVSSTVVVDNANFEASSSVLPPPGWNTYVDPAVGLAYDTTTQFSGLQSIKITTGAGQAGLVAKRTYACRPGDVFRISCRAKLVSGTGPAEIALSFRDGSGTNLANAIASTASASWTFISGSAIAPASTVYFTIEVFSPAGSSVAEFDEIHIARMQTAFEVTPINTSGAPTVTTTALSQSGATATINVASKTFQFGDGPQTYSAGSVTPAGFGKYFVFADDPGYAGGAVTYQASLVESDVYAGNGRLYFGVITTVGGGGATGGTGAGSGGGRGRLQ